MIIKNAIQAEALIRHFDVTGKLLSVEVEGNGFINDTFVVTFADSTRHSRVVLQRVNQNVFARPQDVMNNLRIISSHCLARLDDEADGAKHHWKVAQIIKTKAGNDFHVDEGGRVWRCLTYIDDACAYNQVQGLDHAEECGLTLGHFLRLVSDLDPDRLTKTIPGYHEPSAYLQVYDAVVDHLSADRPDRLDDPEVGRLMSFVSKRREKLCELDHAMERGELKRRVAHGDPRINNILISNETGKGVAMIDLDTCAPGLIQMDIGDAARSICNPSGEDYESLKDVRFEVDVFRAFMRGFWSEASAFLTETDARYIYQAVWTLPVELGLRFLTDHLNGNVYFKVQNANQNLRRAIGQFHLCEQMERNEPLIREVLEEVTGVH